jgi:hypothetical protein
MQPGHGPPGPQVMNSVHQVFCRTYNISCHPLQAIGSTPDKKRWLTGPLVRSHDAVFGGTGRALGGGGDLLLIRPIRPAVAAEHNAFFHRLSPKDIRLRFFATVRELTPAQLDKFTRLDYDRDMALIAIRKETGETVGVARLVREDDPLVAEFAGIVQPDLQGRGLAMHLM